MSVRRHVARLVTTSAVLGGLLTVGAAPAVADEDSVRVRSTNSFSAGGSPGAVTVEVRKRSEGCVRVRTVLGLRLDGLRADQVRVEVDAGGRWAPVGVSGGGGAVGTPAVDPARPVVCEGKGVRVRYRLSFEAGTPAGRLAVIGQVTTGQGGAFGQEATVARVGGRLAGSPTPTRTPSRSPSPSPSATPSPTEAATTEAAPVVAAQPTMAAVAAEQRAAAAPSGLGSPILYFGVAMVVLGLGLILLLIRRSRADRKSTGAAGEHPVLPPDGAAIPQPRNPGGTTYRSGGPPPAGSGPVAPAGGYARPPAPPSGGLYGSPAPRPAGNVYGAPPGAAGPSAPTGDAHPAGPAGGAPGAGASVPPARPGGTPDAAAGTSGVPRPEGHPALGAGPAPRHPEPPEGGDSTRIMPRLPD
ncbi:hypothetical protein [Micromonospora rosaria]|uniref:hypothetical protein n=1 Tax=Micromonospora rosaria TaxID=47874 RepID=UPI0012FC2381|nr:hypothetical protein [Micromonospora rosaria]